MAGSVSDEAFARAASEVGAVTFDLLEAARQVQAEAAKQGKRISLADVLIQQGVISPIQRETIERKVLAQQTGGVRQLGPYKLLKKLGEGGMGAVYLADDTMVGRKVAVKILPRKYSEEREFLTRFRREAQATGKLNHVNIVMAYNVGEETGTHYYAMEYCEGDTLDRILKRDKVIPWDAATGVVLQAARGLKHAHDHGIIHRDIKPANIFICKPLGTPEGAQVETFAEGFVAKILDLGLSKNIEGGEQSFYTQTGVALGTPHYISPEQAKGEKGIDGRTDIYSLGATFYYLVTGQTPFQGTTAGVIMAKHLTDELTNPQDLNPDIPHGVAHVITKMMAKEPADRYANCKELLDDLELVIDGKMPSSRAMDVGKSSVAVARAPRRAATAPRRTARPLRPVGTRQQQPVERRVTEQPALVPLEALPNRKRLFMGAGVAGLSLLVLVVALAMRTPGKPESGRTETAAAKPAARPAAVQPGTTNLKPETALPKEVALDLGGGVKMEFVLVPAGKFLMGSNSEDARAVTASGASARVTGDLDTETPQHEVTITKPFYMGIFEVTQAQYGALMGANPSKTKGDTLPVESVSWDNAVEFCAKLSAKTGRKARLPSEAEWEHACRAGTTTLFHFGNNAAQLGEYGVHNITSGPQPVGKKKPNAFGLYDMHGNVVEWCQDRFGPCDAAAVTDPQGPPAGTHRVIRGGNAGDRWWGVRSTGRFGRPANSPYPGRGFRVAVDAAPGP